MSQEIYYEPEAIALSCPNCGYTWFYRGFGFTATCSKCRTRIKRVRGFDSDGWYRWAVDMWGHRNYYRIIWYTDRGRLELQQLPPRKPALRLAGFDVTPDDVLEYVGECKEIVREREKKKE